MQLIESDLKSSRDIAPVKWCIIAASTILSIAILQGCFFGGKSLQKGAWSGQYYEDSKSMVEESNAKKYIGKLVWPVSNGKISSLYGPRAETFHKGVDITKKKGVPILAAHDGVIIRQDNEMHGFGKLLILKAESLATMYGHLDEYAKHFNDKIKAGEVIGFLGSTGRATGPHLHLETLIKDENNRFIAVDPLVFYPRKSSCNYLIGDKCAL